MTSARSGPTFARLALSFVIRLAIGAGLLGLAIHLALPADARTDVGAQILGPWLRDPSRSLLAIGLAWSILGVSLAAGALRFRLLLQGAGIDLAWLPLFRAYIIASFFNLVLPGAVLGDVYRVVDARRAGESGGGVLGIVALERLLSLSALGVAVAMVLPLLPEIEGRPLRSGTIVAAIGATTLLPWLPLFARTRALLLRTTESFGWIPERAASALQNALGSLEQIAHQPRVIARGFGLSLGLQWLPVAAVLALSIPLETSVTWIWFAVIVPFVTLVTLLPISLGGTGIRELLFVSLFGAVGMDTVLALSLSIALLATAMLWGATGLLLFSFEGRSQRLDHPA